MARLYTNENFPQPSAEALRTLGHDVLTSHEAGNSGDAVPDEAVLAFATSHQRALVTLNRRHFVALHQSHPDHHGIIFCTVDPDFQSLAGRIDTELREAHPLRGKLIRVNRPPR